MQTTNYEKLKIYITGYGPFMDILENPSQVLVDKIMSEKNNYEAKLNNYCEIVHKTIYEVSVDYVSQNLKDCHALIEKSVTCGNKELHLLVHFGVNSCSSKILLEVIAKNDIYDYVSPRCEISSEGNDLYLCKLNLEDLSNQLREIGHNVTTSTDAGTYLCNFIYYKSSENFSCCDNVIPLFIHIPLPEVCSAEDISKCFFDFLKIVVSKYIK